MPCPHYDIKIVQRSNRQSAVAAAAYQSGEKLFSEYDQERKYYSYKSEIIHKENTVDWNDQKYAEIWRQGCASVRKTSREGSPYHKLRKGSEES